MKIRSLLAIGVMIFAASMSLADSAIEEIDVGDLIERVIAGEDFSGKEIIVSGVALNQTTSGARLVNVGTSDTYNSSSYTNYVSVYDTTVMIKKGKNVSLRILVDTSMATKIGGKSFVVIESAFVKCIVC
jgi:hypothetical protein